MLYLTIPSTELWDEEHKLFRVSPECKIQLEHSLVSLAKWESKWKKPFLTTKDKSREETLDYIRCMTITQNVDPSIYNYIRQEQLNEVAKYIDDDMTATTFGNNNSGRGGKSEIITAEIIYYWMVTFQINWEVQKWHLNRLLALIKVISIKNQPKNKMSKLEAARKQRELNSLRRSNLKTSG